MSSNQNQSNNLVELALMVIDSSIRNGQFIYANRQANKLLAELKRNEYGLPPELSAQLEASLKRTVLFLRPAVGAYSQNQASIDMIRKAFKCVQQPNVK